MLLFSAMLDIDDRMEELDFVRLLIEENQENPHDENRIAKEKIQWDGECLDNTFGDDNLSLETVYYRNEMTMAARFVKNEAGGREWITDYVWNLPDEKMLIQMNRVYSEDATTAETGFSPPAFIKYLIRDNFLKEDGGLPLSEDPIMIGENNIQLLTNAVSGKTVYRYPIVYVSKKFDDNTDPIDIYKLAKRLRGIAHLFVEADNRLAVKIAYQSEDRHTFNGAVTVYYPNKTFDWKTINRHHEQEHNQDGFIKAVLDLVLDYINNRECPQTYSWSSVNQRIERDRRLHKQEERDFAIAKKDEADNEMNYYISEWNKLGAENDELQGEVKSLKGQKRSLKKRIDLLEKELDEARGKIPILDNYDDLPGWVEKYFPKELVLHNKARRALKGECFEDVGLVYKCLKLLGTTYWQMRMCDEITGDDFTAKCHELDIEESPTLSASSAREWGDTYIVDYMGKKHVMDRHIKKGTNREPRYCLRIYFFWDSESEKVVICSLTQHLENSLS